MRDAYLPTASERFQSRGLLGVLTGPTDRDKLLADAYAQFREGVPAQPGTTVGAGPLEGGFVPTGINPLAEQTMDILGFQTPQRDVGGTPAQPAGDFMDLVTNLTKAGPEGQKLAESLMGKLGVGKAQGSQAAVKKVQGVDESGYKTVSFVDPLSGQKISTQRTGEFAFDDQLKAGTKWIQESQIQRVAPALQYLDKGLQDYNAGKGWPGVGRGKNISWTRYALSPEGRRMKAMVQVIQNADLKVMSGGAVTDSEAYRDTLSKALTAANSAEDFAKIYETMIRPMWASSSANIRASFDPRALAELERRNPAAKKFLYVDQWKTESPPASPDKKPGKSKSGFKIISVE